MLAGAGVASRWKPPRCQYQTATAAAAAHEHRATHSHGERELPGWRAAALLLTVRLEERDVPDAALANSEVSIACASAT